MAESKQNATTQKDYTTQSDTKLKCNGKNTSLNFHWNIYLGILNFQEGLGKREPSRVFFFLISLKTCEFLIP